MTGLSRCRPKFSSRAALDVRSRASNLTQASAEVGHERPFALSLQTGRSPGVLVAISKGFLQLQSDNLEKPSIGLFPVWFRR